MTERVVTSRGRLARLGFDDIDRAATLIGSLGDDPVPLLQTVATSAAPDQALALLADLVQTVDDPRQLIAALHADPVLRDRLCLVLGASQALGRHLLRHPRHWHELRGDVPAQLSLRAATDADQLRVEYRRVLLRLAADDLSGVLDIDQVSAALADLAGQTVREALRLAGVELPDQAARCRLAVIGVGKCGGRELNYVSDVDVVFVAETAAGTDEATALRAASQLAARLIRICSEHTGEGTIWPIDAALRPEGRAGPLVRTLGSHIGYYQRWAKTWEYQAMLKARPIAGDRDLGQAYVEAIGPLVWQAADRPGFVQEVQAMRRRVVDQIPVAHGDRELKLGPGGMRDIEFAVQLLQLVHGRGDEALRSSTTLVALDALTAGGYIGRDDGASLGSAYRFLRTLEHRIQLAALRRTHVVPESDDALRALGRSLGFPQDPVTSLQQVWRQHARDVRRLHEKLFFRPLLAAVARLPGEEVRLTPEAAGQRLTALGYADPAAALRHLEALTSGLSRRAAIQQTLLPVMLAWFADAPDPDQGLLAFRRVSDELGSTSWYLRLLRDEGAVAERMARVLASSRYATDLLMRAPQTVAMLADDADLTPRARAPLEAEMTAAVRRHEDPVAAIGSVRAARREELFRTSVADLLGLLGIDSVGAALTDITGATLAAALSTAVDAVAAEAEHDTRVMRLAVVAMGRLGGHELSYGSDADVMFVYTPGPGSGEQEAQAAASAVVHEMQRMLALPAPDPPMGLDAGLRPEGKQGPLVRSLSSYAAYYRRWSHTWEAQALLRAEPICGDRDLCADFTALIDPLRWPAGGLSPDDVGEVRRLKARVDAERLPRGADPATHTKLGRGGLADVEWTVQLLQMQYAGRVPALRTTRTLPALAAAVAAGLVPHADADALTQAWRLASRVRNAIVLVRGRASDSLPRDPRERSGVAYVCGYGAHGAERLVDDYLRVTRQASSVVERLFWA